MAKSISATRCSSCANSDPSALCDSGGRSHPSGQSMSAALPRRRRSGAAVCACLPDKLHALLSSLKDTLALYENLVGSYKLIVDSFEKCADVLREVEPRSVSGPVPCCRLKSSAARITPRLDELASDAILNAYRAGLKAKVLDRVVLLYHGAQQLQEAAQLSYEAATPEPSTQKRHGLLGVLTPLRIPGKAQWTPKNKEEDSPAPNRATEGPYEAAKAAQVTAIQQYSALASTRLGPAFQNFLLFAVAVAADIAVAWESGADGKRAARGTSSVPSSVSVTATEVTLPQATATAATAAASAPQPTHLVATPCLCVRSRSSTPSSPFVVSDRSTLTFVTDGVTSPTLTSYESSAKGGHDVARPALDGVEDVKSQATSFVECLGRVLQNFCEVATCTQHSCAEIGITRSDDSDNATIFSDGLLQYITRVSVNVHSFIDGPQHGWYSAVLEDRVLQPFRVLIRGKTSVTDRRSSVDAAKLTRAAANITRTFRNLTTRHKEHTPTVGGGGRDSVFSRLYVSTNSAVPTSDEPQDPMSPVARACQQGSDLEGIWEDFVAVNVRYYHGLAHTLSESIDYSLATS